MANIFSKTGITNGQTIQPWHVTQSVDAFTGVSSYDITISGSLTLTGSVSSLNGFTGNLTGTSSWASNSVNARLATTASYVLNAVSSSFASTASFVRTAQTASYVASTTTLTGATYPSGSPTVPTVGFKLVAGGNQTDGSNTSTITISEIAGKTYGQDFFVTATSAGITAGSISVQTPVIAPIITFISQAPNTVFNYQIIYY